MFSCISEPFSPAHDISKRCYNRSRFEVQGANQQRVHVNLHPSSLNVFALSCDLGWNHKLGPRTVSVLMLETSRRNCSMDLLLMRVIVSLISSPLFISRSSTWTPHASRVSLDTVRHTDIAEFFFARPISFGNKVSGVLLSPRNMVQPHCLRKNTPFFPLSCNGKSCEWHVATMDLISKVDVVVSVSVVICCRRIFFTFWKNSLSGPAKSSSIPAILKLLTASCTSFPLLRRINIELRMTLRNTVSPLWKHPWRKFKKMNFLLLTKKSAQTNACKSFRNDITQWRFHKDIAACIVCVHRRAKNRVQIVHSSVNSNNQANVDHPRKHARIVFHLRSSGISKSSLLASWRSRKRPIILNIDAMKFT